MDGLVLYALSQGKVSDLLMEKDMIKQATLFCRALRRLDAAQPNANERKFASYDVYNVEANPEFRRAAATVYDQFAKARVSAARENVTELEPQPHDMARNVHATLHALGTELRDKYGGRVDEAIGSYMEKVGGPEHGILDKVHARHKVAAFSDVQFVKSIEDIFTIEQLDSVARAIGHFGTAPEKMAERVYEKMPPVTVVE